MYRRGAHLHAGRVIYRRNRQKFIMHPEFGQLYRTGDRCKIDIRTQRVHFLGQIDTQLKVRGHRVEAQAVEDILQTQFSEIKAAILDYQNETLVAFVAAPSVWEGGNVSGRSGAGGVGRPGDGNSRLNNFQHRRYQHKSSS